MGKQIEKLGMDGVSFHVMRSGKKELDKRGLEVELGAFYINDRGSVYLCAAILKDGIQMKDQDDDGEWYTYGTISFNEWERGAYLKLDKPIEEMELEVLEKMKNMEQFDENTKESTSKEVSVSSSKAVLLSVQASLQKKRDEVELYSRLLERYRSHFSNLVRSYRDKIEKVMEIIETIEIYLGIHEEVMHIQKGQLASIDEPICFRQQVLFMDEEIGDPEDQGMDFKKIGDFDKWLMIDENYKKLIPEVKGIVVLKPRRHDKQYSENWFENFLMNQGNKATYFLVRNGDNLYRLWTNVEVSNRMFPLRDEFDEEAQRKKSPLFFSTSDFDDKKKAYIKQALIFQGIMDRSTILHPIPPGINLMKEETIKGRVKFIRDDELALPTGRLLWRDWLKGINGKIQRGSRIVFIAPTRTYSEDVKYLKQERLSYYHTDWKQLPETGVYKVDTHHTHKDDFKIVYNPGDEIWDYWGGSRPRKKGYSMLIKKSDEFILNYDMIDLDDIEYYLNSRVDRHNYLNMIPVLWKLKKDRIKEIRWEMEFVDLVMRRTKADKKIVLEALRWWKYKNIWKRPVKEDDAKALRMIESRTKRLMYERKRDEKTV